MGWMELTTNIIAGLSCELVLFFLPSPFFEPALGRGPAQIAYMCGIIRDEGKKTLSPPSSIHVPPLD